MSFRQIWTGEPPLLPPISCFISKSWSTNIKLEECRNVSPKCVRDFVSMPTNLHWNSDCCGLPDNKRKEADEDDLKKLCRVKKYLRNTSHIPLTLEANGTHNIKWWVDASYATHDDIKSVVQKSDLWIIYRPINQTLIVHLNVNLLQSMIWCLKYFGQCIFWSHKDTKFMNRYFIKIIRVQCYWKEIA